MYCQGDIIYQQDVNILVVNDVRHPYLRQKGLHYRFCGMDFSLNLRADQHEWCCGHHSSLSNWEASVQALVGPLLKVLK